jgi:DNA-3-methyladenine glycosylase I
MEMEDKIRCAWCGRDPLYIAYHDHEWGVPVHDDRKLFEMLVLEGAQAGLSWITILRKRDHYRQAFEGFDPVKVAGFDDRRMAQLMQDPNLVRNRLKIESARKNARAVCRIADAYGSLDVFLWRFVEGVPRRNHWPALSSVPASTAQSEAMSRELKKMGCTFVGPTICYAFMQAVGMVNDHTTDCFRHKQINSPGGS